MLKRLKHLWKLSKKDPELLEGFTEEVLKQVPDMDGKAEFLGEGTQEEYLEYEKEKKGFKGIFGL